MTRREALKRHLPILGIFRSFAAVGVDPAVMGIGPAVAIPAAVKMAGLTIDDIDLFELNEAFASQVGVCIISSSACLRKSVLLSQCGPICILLKACHACIVDTCPSCDATYSSTVSMMC